MKKIFVILLISMFLVSGCAFDGIFDSMFGWLPGYQSSSSGSRQTQNVSSTQTANQRDSSGGLQVNLPEQPCEPHGHFEVAGCVCDKGYVPSGDGMDCVPGGRECTFDKDCGLPSCNGDYKVVPRCNLRDYTCSKESVNCKSEFGTNYGCINGECRLKMTK